MSFHEKSAWVMALALLFGGVFYFAVVASTSSGLGQLAAPGLPLIVVLTIALTILSIVGQVIIAVVAPRDANTKPDEREWKIFHRAGYLAWYASVVGTILSLGLYLLTQDGNLLFYCVFASLVISQLLEYGVQIALYRTGV